METVLPLTRRSLVRGAAVLTPVAASPLATVTAARAAGAGARRCADAARVPTLLAKDMTGRNAGLMHGVPLSYDWAERPRVGAGNRLDGYHAVSAWGQVYESAEGSPATNVRVACRDIALWICSRRTGHWRKANASRAVNGANYVEDFVGNASVPAPLRTEPDGSVSSTLGGGYNFHLYATRSRAAIDPGDVAGIVALYSVRLILDDPSGPDERASARYLASAGADCWRDASVGAAEGTVRDVGHGKARWVRSEWTTVTMSTLGRRRLERSAPPVCLRGR